jgi:hypothetical protein
MPKRQARRQVGAGDRRMSKRLLTERDICTKFITPAITQAGWDLMSQIREQVWGLKSGLSPLPIGRLWQLLAGKIGFLN